MQITLGSKGDYSVRAILELAGAYGASRCKAREISDNMDIPRKYLPQVLGDLVKAGLVGSAAGPGGGYSLTRPPDEISLLEVVEAAEGPVERSRCLLRGGACHRDDACALHAAWARAQEKMIAELAATTFADLAREDAAVEVRKQGASRNHQRLTKGVLHVT